MSRFRKRNAILKGETKSLPFMESVYCSPRLKTKRMKRRKFLVMRGFSSKFPAEKRGNIKV